MIDPDIEGSKLPEVADRRHRVVIERQRLAVGAKLVRLRQQRGDIGRRRIDQARRNHVTRKWRARERRAERIVDRNQGPIGAAQPGEISLALLRPVGTLVTIGVALWVIVP